MLSVVTLLFTLCDISLSSLCIGTTDIKKSAMFLNNMLFLQYLPAVVDRSEAGSIERSLHHVLECRKIQCWLS
jgi:hypothetical protein